ncbi:hypothetical protein BSY238_851 [Methyloversatilis sp. RAC08]|nr:hypothetical protein BSY238_851 [Methyloversatilis sp. RAC08]
MADRDRLFGVWTGGDAIDFIGDRRPESPVSAITDKRLEDFVTRD